MDAVQQSTPLGEGKLSGYSLSLFLLPFLTVLIIPLANWFQLNIYPIPVLVLLAAVLVLAIIGLVKGLPSWSLPNMGLALSLLKLLVFVRLVHELPGLSQLKAQLWTDLMSQRVLYAFIVSVLSWIPSMLLLFGLALLAPWIQGLLALWERLERDWTVLPFLLFATNLLTPLYADAYRRFEPYQLIFMLMMMGGAWLYLWTSRPGHRLIALLTVTLLSGLVLGLGIYQIYPLQTWANDVAPDFPRWWETINPLLDTLALLAGLGAMAAFGRVLQFFERSKVVTA